MWEADQSFGKFGFHVTAKGPQFRWTGKVDLAQAHAAVEDILTVWASVSQWPNAPPFAGGVFDDWPRRLSQGIAFLKAESAVIVAYLRHLETPK